MPNLKLISAPRKEKGKLVAIIDILNIAIKKSEHKNVGSTAEDGHLCNSTKE